LPTRPARVAAARADCAALLAAMICENMDIWLASRNGILAPKKSGS
jgi:hypothetical protein